MRPLHSLLVLVGLVAIVVAVWFSMRDVGPPAPAVAPPEATAGIPEEGGVESELVDPGGEEAPREDRVALWAPSPEPVGPVAAERPSGPALRGRVLDAAGNPVAEARVLAGSDDGFGLSAVPLDTSHANRMPWLQLHETTTDGEGRFELRGPKPGILRLAVRAAGFAPWDRARVALPADEAHELEPIELERSVFLTGRVVDPDGRAVAGADVERFQVVEAGVVLGGGIGMSGALVTTTAADGAFAVDQLASGNFMLRVRHEDHPDQVETGRTHAPGERLDGLTIVMEHGHQIRGRVVGAPASATADLLVRAMPNFGGDARRMLRGADGGLPPESREADVSPDGSFVLRGLRGDQRYQVSARRRPREAGGLFGFLGASLSPVVDALPGDRGVELPYQPEGALTFQVVDAKTREPITEFAVAGGFSFLMPMVGDDGRPVREHPGGRARFGNLRPSSPDERVKLEISATGYREERLDDLQIALGEDTDLGIIALDPVPVLRVTVLDDATGAPVEGAQVILTRRDPELGSRGAVMRRKLELEMDSGHGGGSIQLGDGESRTARTDDEGVALVTSFAGELCDLQVRHPDRAPYRSDRFASPLGEPDEHVVRLLEGGAVTVLLQTPDGSPVGGGKVEHRAPGEDGMSWNFVEGGHTANVTDSEGRVTFAHLAPGTHRFRPESAGGGMGFDGDDGMRVRMRGIRVGGQQRDESWTDVLVSEQSSDEIVVIAPVKVAVFGRVVEGGEPLEGALVALVDAGSDADPLMGMLRGGGLEARTDGRGQYRVENVEAGAYTVRITHPSRHMPAELDLTLGEEERRFDVDLTVAILEGRVTDELGTPLQGVRVWPERAGEAPRPRAMMITVMAVADAGGGGEVVTVGDGGLGSVRATTDEDGRYQLRGVQPGVDLVVKGEGEAVRPGKSEIVQVAGDQLRPGVDLVLSAAGRIEVQAFDKSGAPGRNLLVTAAYEGEAEDVDRVSDFIQQGGVALLEGLTPGPWRVSVRGVSNLTGGGGDGASEQVIEVTVGETQTATFTVD